MAIIPTVRCSQMQRSLAFYTGILDFQRVDGDDREGDPSYNVLARGEDRLILSSHGGDGQYGQAIVIEVDDIDEVFRALRERGYRTPGNPASPVHEGPTKQTWGSTELYVD